MAADGNSSSFVNVMENGTSMEAPNLSCDKPSMKENNSSSGDGPRHHHHARLPQSSSSARDLLMSVSVSANKFKDKIGELALAASEELNAMVGEDTSSSHNLWLYDDARKSEVLNDAGYKPRFAPLDASLEEIIKVITSDGPMELPHMMMTGDGDYNIRTNEEASSLMETEASRACGVVNMDSDRIVNIFMDVEKWSAVFSNMTSKAANLGVLATPGDPGNMDGVIQVMSAEYQFSSPLVKGREIYFARFCRKLVSDSDTWLITDVSLESIFSNPITKCQRRPSGCLIQALSNNSSKVTWVENNVVCYDTVDYMFLPIVASGLAFNANRWVATLQKFCDRTCIQERGELGAGKQSALKLAERMLRSYHANVNSSADMSWTPMPLSGGESILVRTSFNDDDPGLPRGVAVNFTTSIWLPTSQDHLFNFLRDGSNRSKWDILSLGRATRETMSISTTQNSSDDGRVSIVLVEPRPNKMAHLYLQESCKDWTGSYVVYAPIDVFAMYHILEGKSPDVVAILPSGFAILPDGVAVPGRGTNGSILTIAFQIVDEQLSTPEVLPPTSVLTVYTIINQTISLIKNALLYN